jgi:uncharacterized OB-fold protein
VSGTEYQFYVEARNAVGYSVASETFSILAAIRPDAPVPPTTVNIGPRVHLSWSPPSSQPFTDYGDEIHQYKVYIQHSDESNFSFDLVNCDGENDHVVIDSCHCELPIATLQQEPFNLEIGKPVKAKVIAVNRVGDSPPTPTLGLAVSAQEPDAPVSLARWSE